MNCTECKDNGPAQGTDESNCPKCNRCDGGGCGEPCSKCGADYGTRCGDGLMPPEGSGPCLDGVRRCICVRVDSINAAINGHLDKVIGPEDSGPSRPARTNLSIPLDEVLPLLKLAAGYLKTFSDPTDGEASRALEAFRAAHPGVL